MPTGGRSTTWYAGFREPAHASLASVAAGRRGVARSMRGGLDLGGTKIQAVVTARGARVVGQARRNTPARGGPEVLVSDLAGAMRDAATAAGIDAGELESVGIGAPGASTPRRGRSCRWRTSRGSTGRFLWVRRLPRCWACRWRSATTSPSRSRPSGASAPGEGCARSSVCSGGRVSAEASSPTGDCSWAAARQERSATCAQRPAGAAATAVSAGVSRRTPAGGRSRRAPAARPGSGRRCCST